jgi:predicted dinucleotide-utilizing enzyme
VSAYVLIANVAVTFSLAVITTLQVVADPQLAPAPPQVEKL